MDEPDIYVQLTKIFHEVFDDEETQLTAELAADHAEGWDSLTHIRLIIATQKVFKVKLLGSEIGKSKNVGDLVKLIKQRT